MGQPPALSQCHGEPGTRCFLSVPAPGSPEPRTCPWELQGARPGQPPAVGKLPGSLWKEERMWCAVRTGRCEHAGCQSRSSCPPLRRERGWKCSCFREEKSCSISLLSCFSLSVLCGCRSTAVSPVVSCRLCSQPCEAWPWCSTARPQRPPATTGSCSTGSTSRAPGRSSKPAGKLECR